MTVAHSAFCRLAAISLTAVSLLFPIATHAEQRPPKVLTQEEAALQAKQQQAEAELAAKKMRDKWNRKRSTLPESEWANDLPEDKIGATKTQRQQSRAKTVVPAQEDKKQQQAKSKIPKAGKSQLPGSTVSQMDPNGSKSDRQFRRDSSDKKRKPSWSRPKGW